MDAAQPFAMNLLQIHEPGETPNPHQDNAAVGIDLGTTHSVVAIAKDGKANVLHDICGGVLVPSVVYYGEDGTVQVGKTARARLQEGDTQTVSSIKRLMGRGYNDAKALKFPFALEESESGMVKLAIGSRKLSPVEVSADILRHLKELAEVALGQNVTQAVITVPAYFDDSARQATKDAAMLAGLKVLRLINEPTAAALAYGLETQAEGVYAIYDLGGGTFDISILRLEKGVFQVLATNGDIALGGDDFDQAIADTFILQQKLNLNSSEKAILLSKARSAKEQLSVAKETVIECLGKTLSITSKQLEKLMEPYIKRTLGICAQALEDADFVTSDIQGVVLVGGSTRSPYVHSQVKAFFERNPLSDINPDEVVAVGAAIQADGLTRGSDNLLLDVVPLSLGLETMGGIVEKIIYRNTPIPVSVSQEFTTYQDAQTGMVIHVLQGEREMVDQNRSLARFELLGIPPFPAGIARIRVTFSVDADGLLSVSALEETTKIEQSVSVKPSYGLGEGEIERMLMDSMRNAKEDIVERLLREAVMESNRSLEEIKSVLKYDADLLDENERAEIQHQVHVLEQTLIGKDRDKIDFEREQLHTVCRPLAERRMDRAIKSALKGAHISDVVNS